MADNAANVPSETDILITLTKAFLLKYTEMVPDFVTICLVDRLFPFQRFRGLGAVRSIGLLPYIPPAVRCYRNVSGCRGRWNGGVLLLRCQTFGGNSECSGADAGKMGGYMHPSKTNSVTSKSFNYIL